MEALLMPLTVTLICAIAVLAINDGWPDGLA